MVRDPDAYLLGRPWRTRELHLDRVIDAAGQDGRGLSVSIAGRHVLVLAERATLGWTIAHRCLEEAARVTLTGPDLDELNRALLARPELASAALDLCDESALQALLRSLSPVDAVAITLGSRARFERGEVTWPDAGSLRELLQRVTRQLPGHVRVLVVHGLGSRGNRHPELDPLRNAVASTVRTVSAQIVPQSLDLLAHPSQLTPAPSDTNGRRNLPSDVARLATALLGGTTSGAVVELDQPSAR